MDSSQDHGAALHGSSSCQVRCCTVQRPQCALLSAADHPRRAGVERSTSSTSSFIASTGTAAACRRPPAQLRRRADATADHMGPVAVQADLVVPPVSFVGPCVCGYRALFFHFIDEYNLQGYKRMMDVFACTLSHRVPWRPAARHGSSRLTRPRCTTLRVLPSSFCKVFGVVVHAASEYATSTTGFHPSSPHGLHITIPGSSTSRLPEFGYTRASARQEAGTIQNGG